MAHLAIGESWLVQKQNAVSNFSGFHLISLIRDTAPEGLVLSLKFFRKLTRDVTFLSIIFTATLPSVLYIRTRHVLLLCYRLDFGREVQ